MSKFVRLKPYDKKAGHLMQRFTLRSKRLIAGEWYKVPDSMAEELSKVQQPHAPGSTTKAPTPLAFDIADNEAQQLSIEKASRPKAPVEMTTDLTDANDLRTTDLTGGTASAETSEGPAEDGRRGTGPSRGRR